MTQGFFGKKLGMTQVFAGNKVVPVTVVDVSNWFVLGTKNQARDGYDAVVVGLVRKRFEGQPFSADWCKTLKRFFRVVKEVKLQDNTQELSIGQHANFFETFQEGSLVDVVGTTKGCGFAGVVKRHNFKGGCSSHGDKTGRRTGSVGHLRARGRVVKGKRLPGHMGVIKKTVQNLQLVKIEKNAQFVLIKGAVPGKSGSVVFVQNGVKA
jgi:large subunit ribosomal protein L3